MPDDVHFMQQALTLARESVALASPNPQVGCVLKINELVIGQGAHHYEARDHAEIVALKQAAALGHSARGATAYVTLEPCSHHGRTGPCADAFLAASVTRVVVATADPNPQVAGQGIARLRAAGVEVTVGVCEPEARTLNNAFAWAITQGRPFVTLKAALSADGMLAPADHLRHSAGTGRAEPHWLTGPLARADVQQLRHASDAILTGIGTVLADNPALTDRTTLPRRRPLMRVVLDTSLRIPLDSTLATTINNDLWLFSSEAAHQTQPEKLATLKSRGAICVALPSPLNLHAVLAELNAPNFRSILLEAGSQLNAAFLQAGLVDEAVLYYAPVELGPIATPFARNGSLAGPTPFALEQRFLSVTRQTIGPDLRVSGLIHNPWAALPSTR